MDNARMWLRAGFGDEIAKKFIEKLERQDDDEQIDGQDGNERTDVKLAKSPLEMLLEAFNKQSK